jgi:IS5 family transposase
MEEDPMATITEQMTEIYSFIDDYLKRHPKLTHWRQSPQAEPAFSDAEVLTLGLMQGCLGVATLKKTYLLLAYNYRSAFPQLCGYKQWIARLHALGPLLNPLWEASRDCNRSDLSLYVLDSKPIAVCRPIRHGQVRLLREEGACFGKTNAGWFFGFKLHALMNISGAVEALVLTPANWDDRYLALTLAQSVDGGIALGDLGYNGKEIAQLLAEEAQLLLITPDVAGRHQHLIKSQRARVETLFSQLCNRFLDRVFARSWQGLWNTLKLKVLHYNLCHAGILSV